MLDQAAARVAVVAPDVHVDTVVDLDASAPTSLLAAAADAEMLVLGSHDRTALGEWAFQEAYLWKTGVTAVHVWGVAVVGGSEPTMYGLLEPAQLERAEQEHAALLSERSPDGARSGRTWRCMRPW